MDKEQLEKERIFSAKKKVKKMRTLYLNAFAFLMVNVFIVIDSYLPPSVNENHYYILLVIWGVWLGYTALKVSGRFWIFSEKWEKKEIEKVLAKTKDISQQSS